MDTISAAEKLRCLLVFHDNAQRQIQAIDCVLHKLMERVTQQAPSGHIIAGMKILQRTAIIKAVKEMYVTYKKKKWQQIQALVHVIMNNLGQPSDDMADDEVPDNHEVIIIAKGMSLDFCELNRFC